MGIVDSYLGVEVVLAFEENIMSKNNVNNEVKSTTIANIDYIGNILSANTISDDTFNAAMRFKSNEAKILSALGDGVSVAKGENSYPYQAQKRSDRNHWITNVSEKISMNQMLPKWEQNGPNTPVAVWEYDNLRKLGKQGGSPSADYLIKNCVAPYYTNAHTRDALVSRTSTGFKLTDLGSRIVTTAALELRRLIGLSTGEFLTPLTVDEAIDVAAKATSAHPYGGQKNDPENRARVRTDLMNGTSSVGALAGARYQRNKQTAEGQPKFRGIFNDDYRSVVQAARFEHVLIEAFQKISERESGNPFAELNGANAVGEAMYKSTQRVTEKGIVYDAPLHAGVDLRACDTQINIADGFFVFSIYQYLFDKKYHKELWQTIQHAFTVPLNINNKIYIGLHNLFSGVTWTHLIESTEFWAINYYVTKFTMVTFNVDTSKTDAWKALDYKRPVLLQNGGDDQDISIFVNPTGNTFILLTKYFTWLDEDEFYSEFTGVLMRVYEYLGFDVKEVTYTFEYTIYESRFFSRRAMNAHGTGYRPVYSTVMAWNQIAYPEDGCGETERDEIIRSLSIAVQTLGNPICHQFVKLWHRNMTPRLAAELKNLLSLGDDFIIRDISAALDNCGSYSRKGSYYDEDVSTLLNMLRDEMKVEKIDHTDPRVKIRSNAIKLRALMWYFRVAANNLMCIDTGDYSSTDNDAVNDPEQSFEVTMHKLRLLLADADSDGKFNRLEDLFGNFEAAYYLDWYGHPSEEGPDLKNYRVMQRVSDHTEYMPKIKTDKNGNAEANASVPDYDWAAAQAELEMYTGLNDSESFDVDL